MSQKVIFSNLAFFKDELAPLTKGSPEYDAAWSAYTKKIEAIQEKLVLITPKSKCATYGHFVDGDRSAPTGIHAFPVEEDNLATLLSTTSTQVLELYLNDTDVLLDYYDENFKLTSCLYVRDLQGQYFERIKGDFETDGTTARSFLKTRSLRTIFNVTF